MSIPVKATQLGFYGTKLRYEGEEFEVASISELGSWMERQDGGPNRGEEGFQEELAAAPQAPAPKAAPARAGRAAAPQAPAPKAAKADEGRASDQGLI